MTSTAPALKPALTRAEACEQLGCSPRTLNRYVADGRIVSYYMRGASGQQEARFRPHEVAALKAELDVPAIRAVTPPAVQALATVAAPAIREIGDSVGAALAKIADAMRPAATAKPWLTLDEAAAYSGLPKAFLLRVAVARQRPEHVPIAVNVGSEARVSWRFNREELGR